MAEKDNKNTYNPFASVGGGTDQSSAYSGAGARRPLGYMSEDLGSGAKTTVGGSYINPRLGIEDTTAFTRGFASAFTVPEPEEEQVVDPLEGITSDYFQEKDDMMTYVDSDGVTHTGSIGANSLMDEKFKIGELAKLNEQNKKCVKAKDQQCVDAISDRITKWNSHFVGDKSNFNLAVNMLDSAVMDKNISTLQMPGVDYGFPGGGRRQNTDITWAQYAYINKNNPQDIEYATRNNMHGQEQFGVNVFDRQTGKTSFINVSAMGEKWRTDNFKVRYVEGDDFKTSRERHGQNVAKGSDVLQTHNEGITRLENGDTIQISTAGKYYQPASIRTYEETVAGIVDQDIASIHDPKNASRWHQLTEEYKNQKFIPSTALIADLAEELYPDIDKTEAINQIMEDFKNKDFNWHDKKMSQELRLNLIKDHYGERYKIINGGKAFFEEAEDPNTMGRAIANTIENDLIIRDRKQSDLKRSDAAQLTISAGEDIYNTFIAEFVDLKGRKKPDGDIFAKHEINANKFAEFMTLTQKNTGDIWLTRDQILSGENNDIYKLWAAKQKKDGVAEDEITKDIFNKELNQNLVGDRAQLWRFTPNGKREAQPTFDGNLLGAMSIYASHTHMGGNTNSMMNYAKNRFLYGKDVGKFSDPFKFYKAGPPTQYMPSGYGGEHQQSTGTGPGGDFEHQDVAYLPTIESIIHQDYKIVKTNN